jgi:hypothetical protein
MAIKKKEERSQFNLPAKLQNLVTKAFGEQFLKDKFEKKFKDTKADMEAYLSSNEDGFDIEAGKSVKCEEGSFYYTERNTISVDKDALIDLVESGKISLAQVLACVSTFKNEELEKAISTSKFKEISSVKTSASLTLKANAEYKAKMEADFEGGFSTPIEEEKKEEKEESLLDTSKLKSKKKAIKKVEVEDVDDDLDSILRG